jgi:hypothetical protein
VGLLYGALAGSGRCGSLQLRHARSDDGRAGAAQGVAIGLGSGECGSGVGRLE